MANWSEYALPPITDEEPEGYMKRAYMSGDEFDPATRRELWRIAKDTEWSIHLYSVVRCCDILFQRDIKSRYSVDEYLEACVFKHLFPDNESWIKILIESGREKHHNLTDGDKKKILDHVSKTYGVGKDQLVRKLEAFQSKIIDFLSDGPASN